MRDLDHYLRCLVRDEVSELLEGYLEALEDRLVARLVEAFAEKAPPAGDAFDQLLTRREVAERLGIDYRTVPRLVQAGDIPRPVSVGKRQRWRKGDLPGAVAQGDQSC